MSGATGALLALALAATAPAKATPGPGTDPEWSKDHAGETIDLSRYRLSYSENFAKGRLSPIWRTPFYNFGLSRFIRDGSQLTVAPHRLTVNQTYNGKEWRSTILQSVDPKTGQGFSQTYGYFEVTAVMPGDDGVWPAFWMQSLNFVTDKTTPFAEIDVAELYGPDPTLHSSVHIWPASNSNKDPGYRVTQMRNGPLPALYDGKPHTYGVDVEPDLIRIYFDRRELGRIATPPEAQRPVFMLIGVAMKHKPSALEPMRMTVLDMRAYQRRADSDERPRGRRRTRR